MRKILRVYEKSCIPIRKKSQLLYTIYRKWLLINEPIKCKVDEIRPLNFNGVDNRLKVTKFVHLIPASRAKIVRFVLQNTFKSPIGGWDAGGVGDDNQLKLWGLGSSLKGICYPLWRDLKVLLNGWINLGMPFRVDPSPHNFNWLSSPQVIKRF